MTFAIWKFSKTFLDKQTTLRCPTFMTSWELVTSLGLLNDLLRGSRCGGGGGGGVPMSHVCFKKWSNPKIPMSLVSFRSLFHSTNIEVEYVI